MIEQHLSKFKHRAKRGIKYITGNPDENDLIKINKNLGSLYKSQNAIVRQVDEYTSFANHITQRYSKGLEVIQSNVNSSLKVIKDVSNILDAQLAIQCNNYLSQKLLNTLRIIEQTTSLAFSEIPNLEIISDSELIQIINHLKLIYKSTELLELDTIHIFKILEFSKFRVISIKDVITCILYEYSRIYPIPDSQREVLIPPYKYHLQSVNSESWSDERCKVIGNLSVCVEKPQLNKCSFNDKTNCMYAVANNKYRLYVQLHNEKILISSKSKLEIIEECPEKINRIKIKHNALLSSKINCKIIIGNQTFTNTFVNFTFKPLLKVNDYKANTIVNLQLTHLYDLQKLKEEAKNLGSNIKLHPIIHIMHLSVTFVLILILCIIIILVYVFRNKIREIIRKHLQQRWQAEVIPLQEITNAYQNEDGLS
ncbi:hypothetical protein ILUMI_09313 [Ignelater luminosus]|uniref:Uncharacterized protein n=1 Tax=Ignelater luminosus TaxID=2038154 RepID=A0A8K0GEN2_IGNLU|nr:hypothetical protein ILUMI_09313 [Ignelater luminosus]